MDSDLPAKLAGAPMSRGDLTPRIDLVVVDLDNTLFDWMSAFVPALYEMAHAASGIVGVDVDIVLADLRAVSRRHADLEHPFALLETEAVRRAFAGLAYDEVSAALDPAFLAFNRRRKLELKLYDGVEATLDAIAAAGVPVVAYTDARVVNALFRIRTLGLRRFLSRLYAPASLFMAVTDDGDGFLRALDPTDRKPDPHILMRICNDHGVHPDRALCVGDSVTRDVHMAVRAGCRAAWARYGTVIDPALKPMLVKVSHWTHADVVRERRLAEEAREDRPDAVLDRFDELLQLFDIGGVRRRA